MREGQNGILSEGFLSRTREFTKSPCGGNKAASPYAALDLQLLARDIVKQSGDKKTIVLTTGLGLSDQGVPIRLPSLIVPGLKILDSLKELENVGLHYVVYQARDIITDMNKLKPTQAFNNAVICAEYLRGFVDRFFPDLSEKVTILDGDKVKIEEDDLSALAERLRKSAGTPIEQDMAVIKGYGARRDTKDESYLYYAAANVILNGGYGPSYPIKEHLPDETSIVIPLGGKREKPFFSLTRHIATETAAPFQIIPVIVPYGQIPAYYPNRKGDLLVGDGQNVIDFEPPSEIEKDFAVLENLGITREQLKELSEPLI